jgi:3-hydroxy acid dehydrogenase/malonic semialdehyde reductase
MVAFSITRFRGDEEAAKKVYQGFEPLTAEDVAEDIVWAASRKDHM